MWFPVRTIATVAADERDNKQAWTSKRAMDRGAIRELSDAHTVEIEISLSDLDDTAERGAPGRDAGRVYQARILPLVPSAPSRGAGRS